MHPAEIVTRIIREVGSSDATLIVGEVYVTVRDINMVPTAPIPVNLLRTIIRLFMFQLEIIVRRRGRRPQQSAPL